MTINTSFKTSYLNDKRLLSDLKIDDFSAKPRAVESDVMDIAAFMDELDKSHTITNLPS